MVQLSSRFFFIAAAIVTCYASPLKRAATDDGNAITASTNAFRQALNTFPGDLNTYRTAGEALNRDLNQGAQNLVNIKVILRPVLQKKTLLIFLFKAHWHRGSSCS